MFVSQVAGLWLKRMPDAIISLVGVECKPLRQNIMSLWYTDCFGYLGTSAIAVDKTLLVEWVAIPARDHSTSP